MEQGNLLELANRKAVQEQNEKSLKEAAVKREVQEKKQETKKYEKPTMKKVEKKPEAKPVVKEPKQEQRQEKKISKNIYQKLLSVMSKVGKIPKRGYNSYANYHYVNKDVLYDYMRKFLSEEGLAIITSIDEMDRLVADNNATNVKVRFKIVNVDNPEEVIESVYWGVGMDKGDKDLYKALTGAMKYFLIDNFLISGGDTVPGDVESEEVKTEPMDVLMAKFSKAEKDELRKLWKEKRLTKESFWNIAKDRKTTKEIIEAVRAL